MAVTDYTDGAEDVQVRVPYHKITSATKPSTTTVNSWIVEGEKLVDSALKTAGATTTPIADKDGQIVIKSWVLDFAAGMVLRAYAVAGNDGDNDAGESWIEKFEDRLEDIYENPERYASMFPSGWTTSDSDRKMRGHVKDNRDSKSISNGDFLPSFNIADRGKQF